MSRLGEALALKISLDDQVLNESSRDKFNNRAIFILESFRKRKDQINLL